MSIAVPLTRGLFTNFPTKKALAFMQEPLNYLVVSDEINFTT
ncbi:hypothetical protein GXM_04455 [Nostoc sphaeroides CCNUC1]|uniref:Uncharacterized protein n=1 Tax=Nostoc sphaeroides CCNUC1 TaxID=2653204 RepID=A0A5P8W2Y8_9NOSO|nr:hypothetical protein GXM_04455 [Nostoc sphaeroides CCNUC1]